MDASNLWNFHTSSLWWKFLPPQIQGTFIINRYAELPVRLAQSLMVPLYKESLVLALPYRLADLLGNALLHEPFVFTLQKMSRASYYAVPIGCSAADTLASQTAEGASTVVGYPAEL